MISLSRLGMILLSIWAFLEGLTRLAIWGAPDLLMGILLVVAGICLFFANVRVTA